LSYNALPTLRDAASAVTGFFIFMYLSGTTQGSPADNVKEYKHAIAVANAIHTRKFFIWKEYLSD
jgi:hypothetical protein